jgi:hypothetical protein
MCMTCDKPCRIKTQFVICNDVQGSQLLWQMCTMTAQLKYPKNLPLLNAIPDRVLYLNVILNI